MDRKKDSDIKKYIDRYKNRQIDTKIDRQIQKQKSQIDRTLYLLGLQEGILLAFQQRSLFLKE